MITEKDFIEIDGSLIAKTEIQGITKVLPEYGMFSVKVMYFDQIKSVGKYKTMSEAEDARVQFLKKLFGHEVNTNKT
jgi:hypothetical protein